MKIIEVLKEQFDSFEVIEEKWNEQYEGILIKVNGQSRYKRCRLAHKTPRKEGYFTAFWKKDQFN
ncbi:TPA: MepB family protein, partial [Streptococcus suis]